MSTSEQQIREAGDTIDVVSKAMRRAYGLGQSYWQQVDSEYASHHRKADMTQAKFDQLVDETRKSLLSTLDSLRAEVEALRADARR